MPKPQRSIDPSPDQTTPDLPPLLKEKNTSGAETMKEQNASPINIDRPPNHPTRQEIALARPTTHQLLQSPLVNCTAQTEVKVTVGSTPAHTKGTALRVDSTPAPKRERRLEPQRKTTTMKKTTPVSPTLAPSLPPPIQTATTGMKKKRIVAQ